MVGSAIDEAVLNDATIAAKPFDAHVEGLHIRAKINQEGETAEPDIPIMVSGRSRVEAPCNSMHVVALEC